MSEATLASAEAIVRAIEVSTERRGVPPHEVVTVAAMALSEIIIDRLGPRGSVVYLRGLADEIDRRAQSML